LTRRQRFDAAIFATLLAGTFSPPGAHSMNKDQVKGVAKDIAGKVQETAGEIINSKDQQAKGLTKQVEGKAQKAVGDVKDAVDDALNK
jgi:uncharacterized protein YjbJ (UPF0337 family)